jgi:hypothetical protein
VETNEFSPVADYSAILVSKNMTAALNEPATGRVTIQAKMMFL